jgi:hypothetical protein
MRRGRGILAIVKPLAQALMILERECIECIADYEEAIELWITYGGE